MSTCNRLDLQTLGSQLIMPKILSDHWTEGQQSQRQNHWEPRKKTRPLRGEAEPLGREHRQKIWLPIAGQKDNFIVCRVTVDDDVGPWEENLLYVGGRFSCSFFQDIIMSMGTRWRSSGVSFDWILS